MPRYIADHPAGLQGEDLVEFLYRELQRIELALTEIFDGEQTALEELPTRDTTPVLAYGGADFDLGDGEGMYLKIGRQWYKLEMRKVGPARPLSGNIELVGNTAAVNVT